MQPFLGQKSRASLRGLVPTWGLGVGVLLGVGACGHADDSSNAGGSGGAAPAAGGAASASSAGAQSAGAHSAGASGAPQTAEAGRAGAAGDGVGSDAGAAGEAGTAGAPAPSAGCAPGGVLFAPGNYADEHGNELWLRTNAQATTLALIPRGLAKAANPPQIFVVERVCASGSALLARAPSFVYRFDFSLSGNALAVCQSAAASSVQAALALAPANFTRAADTGCAGKPFNVFLTEATP